MLTNEESFKSVDEALQEIGLSELERKLYSLSLRLGPSRLSTLATNLGVSRPNIYKIIAGLEERGLAQFSKVIPRKKTFMVEPPGVVADALRAHKRRVDSLESILTGHLPALLTQYQQGELPTKTRIVQGKQQFVDAIVKPFSEVKEEFCYFGSLDPFISFITPEYARTTRLQRIKRNVRIRALVPESELAHTFRNEDARELRTTRFLKPMSPFETSFYIFGRTVLLLQPTAALAVVVEDEYLARMFQAIFDALWEQAE